MWAPEPTGDLVREQGERLRAVPQPPARLQQLEREGRAAEQIVAETAGWARAMGQRLAAAAEAAAGS